MKEHKRNGSNLSGGYVDLHLDWLRPYILRDDSTGHSTYTFEEMDDLPSVAGVYVFGRRHGEQFTPIYVGKALLLSTRIPQQLNNNRLMNFLWHAPNGQRELHVAGLITRQGQQAGRVLKVIETGLIKYALAQGHDLVNVHGTRLSAHSVLMQGNRESRSWLHKRVLHFESK